MSCAVFTRDVRVTAGGWMAQKVGGDGLHVAGGCVWFRRKTERASAPILCTLLDWAGVAPDYACSLSMRGGLPYSRTWLGATGNGG